MNLNMKLFYFSTLAFLCININAQSIIVNPASAPESNLNAEDLTVEVLIDGGACSSISNFQLKENNLDPFPNANRSWGYFEKGNSDFPFEKGIVLTSGKAKDAEGPSTGNVSYGSYSWTGDAQASVLANYSTNNATVFEFDFVPFGNEISFNYIFASEEHPTFSCNSDYNDVFGFIISGPGIVNDPGLNGKNIALLPNGDYVTINNVNNGWCGDAEFYVPGNFPYIEYGGRTTILTAYSEVIPGETYHIRLLVSDSGDTSYDSAVFLEAGSFNLGSTLVDLDGAEIGEDETVCGEDEFTLVVNLVASNATYQWSYNGVEIPGATNQSYTATQSGYYSVEIISGGCNTNIGAEITFSSPIEVNNVEDFNCNNTGTHVFNLTAYQPQISTSPNVEFAYYQTLAGAEAEDATQLIPNITDYPVTNQAIVYVRVNNQLGCYEITTLTLNVGIGPETQPAQYDTCDDNGDGIAEFDLTSYNNIIVLSGVTGLEFEYYTSQADAENGVNPITNPTNYTNTSNPQIIYVKTYSMSNGTPDCEKIEKLTLAVEAFPATQDWTITACNNLNNTAEIIDLTNNQIIASTGVPATLRYYPTLNDLQAGTNEITNPTNYVVTNQTTVVYIKIESSSGNCIDEKTLTVNLNPSPVVNNSILENCSFNEQSTFYLPDAITDIVQNSNEMIISFHNTYNNALSNTNPLPNNYTNITPNQIIYVRVQNQNGCFSIAELTLKSNVTHEMINTPLNICNDPYQIYNGIATFDLTQMETEISNALGVNNLNLIYFNTLQNAQTGTNPIEDPYNYINTSPTQTIYVRAFDQDGGCIGTAEFQINVDENPFIDIENTISFCESSGSIDYELQGSFQTITWFNPEGEIISNSPLVTFEQEGTYTVEVTQTGMNCPSKRDIDVVFDIAPNITSIDVNGSTVSVSVSGGSAPYEYSYNNGLTWSNTATMHNVLPGIYYMIVKSKYGCYSEKILFGVLGIPNVITPNGDGYNDYFTIRGLELYPNAHIQIFDRYGKIFVNRKIGSNFIWDGKYQGRVLPSGDYWYIITIDEDKKISGHVAVKNY